MDKKRSIGIRISNQRLEALLDVCNVVLGNFFPIDDHQSLLREYLRELQHKLLSMAKKEQELYTLTLSSTEAMAFYQLWQVMNIKHDKYATVIVSTMLAKIGNMAA